MSYNLEEQDQIENLRDFWSRWGTLISSLVLVAALAWAGYAGWQWWQARQSTQASALFGQVNKDIQAGNLQQAAPAWADLQSKFSSSLYAQMGGLAMAKAYADAGKASEAEATLRWTAEHGESESYRAVAMLNLAALQIDSKQFQAALATVKQAPAPSFEALFATRRGDIETLLGQPQAARKDYEAAMKQLPPSSGYRQLVQLKLESVGGQAS
jgi:predicted negative regulator of RcsB-dependent stress response